MARLAPVELDRRLRMDERTASLINFDPAPIEISAHGTAQDAIRGAGAIAPGAGTRPPEHYRVVYDFDTLGARDQPLRPTTVHIDLLANGNYPFTEPVCRVVGSKVPWTPHFDASWPICVGDGWSGAGRKLLVDLVVHIARLLNFDEPPPQAGYHGYNPAAIRWWTTVHECRPLDPNLRLPMIDPNAVAGTAGPRFAAAANGGGSGRFRPVRANPAPVVQLPALAVERARFAPAQRQAFPRFRPAGGAS